MGLLFRVCVFQVGLTLWTASSFAIDSGINPEQDVCATINKLYAEQNKAPTAFEKALYGYSVEQRITAVKCLAETGDSGVIKPLAGLFAQERFSSPVKPEIINALVKLKGNPAKLALMDLLRTELDALYPIQQNLHPHVLGEEYHLIKTIMTSLEEYGDKDLADYLMSLAKNADEKWNDVICEGAYKSYLIISGKLDNKLTIKDKVDFYASHIEGGNPSVNDYVQGKSGIKKFTAIQEYGARAAMVSTGFTALPETWVLAKSLPASRKREALAIIVASILANNLDNNDPIVDKIAVLTWLLNEYKNLSKEEKFGSHFYLLQQLSLVKLRSQDTQIQKLISDVVDEKNFKPVDLDALKKKVVEEQKAYEKKRLESKPVEIRNIIDKIDRAKKTPNSEGVLFLVNQLANKDFDVVWKDVETLHEIAKSSENKNLVWPYVDKILDATESMDEKFLIDIAKILSWVEKPGVEKVLIHVLEEGNKPGVNKKIVSLFVLGHMHNTESLKLTPELRSSASGKLRSAIDMYLSEFGINTWMKSDLEIKEQANQILKTSGERH